MGCPPEKGQGMRKGLAVAAIFGAFALSEPEADFTVPALFAACQLDVQGYYVPAQGCPVYRSPPPVEDKDCDDPREPCHYKRERPANVRVMTQEKVS